MLLNVQLRFIETVASKQIHFLAHVSLPLLRVATSVNGRYGQPVKTGARPVSVVLVTATLPIPHATHLAPLARLGLACLVLGIVRLSA
jgi:hypothetical protein